MNPISLIQLIQNFRVVLVAITMVTKFSTYIPFPKSSRVESSSVSSPVENSILVKENKSLEFFQFDNFQGSNDKLAGLETRIIPGFGSGLSTSQLTDRCSGGCSTAPRAGFGQGAQTY